MRCKLITLGLICLLFALMGVNCNVNVVPVGTDSPSIGVLPASGLLGQGLSYPTAGDTGLPPVGSKMGFWTVY